MKKKIIYIVAICLLLCAFGAGLILREPHQCALCDVPESDVPCLIDLHSGEVCELRVYDETMSDDPTSAYFSFMNILGNTGYRDTIRIALLFFCTAALSITILFYLANSVTD